MCRFEFKLLSNGDKNSKKWWNMITKESILGIEKKLELLNVNATYNIGESFYE
jgi:arginyl-tRNA synthetase